MEEVVEKEKTEEPQDNWAEVAGGLDHIFEKDPGLYEKIRGGYERAWLVTEGGPLAHLSDAYREAISKIEYGASPPREFIEKMGYSPYLTVDKKGVVTIFETAFGQELDWEHVFTHERTHRLMKSGAFGKINAQMLESVAKESGLDTSPVWEESEYIERLREELAKNPTNEKLRTRIRLEQFNERLAFFARAHGDPQKMFELQIASADPSKMPDVLKTGGAAEKQAFLSEHLTAKRHRYFSDWFHQVLIEQEEPEEPFDEEEYELMLEELFGVGLESAESSGFAQPSRGGGLFDWIKYILEPVLK